MVYQIELDPYKYIRDNFVIVYEYVYIEICNHNKRYSNEVNLEINLGKGLLK